MRKPFTIISHLHQDTPVVIDLFDIERLDAIKQYVDEETGEALNFEHEMCLITLEDATEYVADLRPSEILYVAQQMWKHKAKQAIKTVFI